MLNFQDLPDELVLKILSYSETKDLISYGQVSKRIRRISHDGTLWVTANLEKKIVKTELLEMILGKGCRTLNLSHSTIVGHLSSNTKSQLNVLNFSHCECNVDENNDVLEDLLFSCGFLQHLTVEDVLITPKMAVSICNNGKTLQTLNLNSSFLKGLSNSTTPAYSYLQELFKCCQELKEVNLDVYDENGLSDDDLEILAKTISPNVEKLNLNSSLVMDDHIKILISRCKKIKAMSIGAFFHHDSFALTKIRKHLNLTIAE